MTQRGALLGGRYELDQIIGRGGMAEVWRARDTRLERDVAVKRLRVDLASDPTFQARFRREAQSAAGLNHPNIVSVYDTGEERDVVSDVSVPYIVMELVEGVTLREVLRDGRKILPERALEFTAGVLDALAYSHRAGIIHRDIKPANVMLTPNGTVKVMDFGIARAVADTSATMTQTAAVIGTAQYLSPEQARGEKVDNRSDIYSVGCLMYELLTSQPLFKGDSPVSVAYQHVRETPVPPSQIDSEITPPMDAIALKSLAKDPRDRYQDASEMREDIMRALNKQPVLASSPMEQPTQVISSDPMTTTARRGVIPAATGAAAGGAAAGAGTRTTIETVEEDEEPKNRKGLVILLVIAGIILAAMAYAIYTIMNPSTPEPSPTPTETTTQVQTVAVPSVLGQSQIAATDVLTRAGFEVEALPKVGTDQDKGLVIEQNPPGDEMVEPGSKVTIYVSSGVEVETVPDGITDVPYETAKTILEQAGFTNIAPPINANPAEEPVTAKAGDVIETNPLPGTDVETDTLIELTVATGKSVVPPLRTLTWEEAQRTAERAGFRVEQEPVETSEQQAGSVFDQSLAPESIADRSEVIVVKIAVAPPEPEETETPSPPPASESETPSPNPDPTTDPSATESASAEPTETATP